VERQIQSIENRLAHPDTSKVTYYLGNRNPLAADPLFNERTPRSYIYDGKYMNHDASITLTQLSPFFVYFECEQ
jgi:hypothetical protein